MTPHILGESGRTRVVHVVLGNPGNSRFTPLSKKRKNVCPSPDREEPRVGTRRAAPEPALESLRELKCPARWRGWVGQLDAEDDRPTYKRAVRRQSSYLPARLQEILSAGTIENSSPWPGSRTNTIPFHSATRHVFDPVAQHHPSSAPFQPSSQIERQEQNDWPIMCPCPPPQQRFPRRVPPAALHRQGRRSRICDLLSHSSRREAEAPSGEKCFHAS